MSRTYRREVTRNKDVEHSRSRLDEIVSDIELDESIEDWKEEVDIPPSDDDYFYLNV